MDSLANSVQRIAQQTANSVHSGGSQTIKRSVRELKAYVNALKAASTERISLELPSRSSSVDAMLFPLANNSVQSKLIGVIGEQFQARPFSAFGPDTHSEFANKFFDVPPYTCSNLVH